MIILTTVTCGWNCIGLLVPWPQSEHTHGCLFCLWVQFFKKFYLVIRSTQYLFFSDFISFSMMPSRSIHIIINGRIPSSFYGWVTLPCMLYHIFFIHSSLGYVSDYAAVNMGLQVSLPDSDFIYFDHVLLLFLIWGTSMLFSIVTVLVYIPLTVRESSLFSTSSPMPVTVFLIIADLTGVRWYLTVVWSVDLDWGPSSFSSFPGDSDMQPLDSF